MTIHIDCQSPSVYLMKWNALLARLCSDISGCSQKLLSDADQVRLFEKLVDESSQKIVLIFDEIENISLDLSPAIHWNEDFLHFWGTIRSVHQASKGKLTFGVAGVNPHIFEIPLVSGKDNPILLSVSPLYLLPLDQQSIKEMVRTIGRYMGLEFQEDIYQWLYEQFGGHPLLTRKVCSLIDNKTNKKSGDTFTIKEFTSRQSWIDEQLGRDILNMLVILVQHYPDEFDNLTLLAEGNHKWIQEVKRDDPQTLTHILNYGIISEEAGQFKFIIESLERFLLKDGHTLKTAVQTLTVSSNPTNYEHLPNPNQQHLELWTRVGKARNAVEPKLRMLLHRALLFQYGEKKALQRVLQKFSTDKQRTLAGYSLAQLFNGESKAIYLKDLKEIVLREWEVVKHVFGDRKVFEIRMDELNTEGRADAHANPTTERAVIHVETVAQELLNQITPYLD